MGSVCHEYMYILLYMKHIWCSGFPEIYAQLQDGGGGQSAMSICTFCYVGNLFDVVVFQRSMLRLEKGGGASLPWVYVHSSICET